MYTCIHDGKQVSHEPTFSNQRTDWTKQLSNQHENANGDDENDDIFTSGGAWNNWQGLNWGQLSNNSHSYAQRRRRVTRISA